MTKGQRIVVFIITMVGVVIVALVVWDGLAVSSEVSKLMKSLSLLRRTKKPNPTASGMAYAVGYVVRFAKFACN